MYYYVKDSPTTSDTVTMIRISALAPLEGSYDEVLNLTEELMGDIFLCMFEQGEKEEPVLFILLASLTGKVVIFLLLLVPLAIIFYPQIKRISSKFSGLLSRQ